MLMNRLNNNPSSHTRQKENEKLCKGFCLFFQPCFKTKFKLSHPRQGEHFLVLRNSTYLMIVQAVLRHQSSGKQSNSFWFKGTPQTLRDPFFQLHE